MKIREDAPCLNDLGFSPPLSVGKESYNLFDDNVLTTLRSIYLPQESYTGQLTAPAVKPT